MILIWIKGENDMGRLNGTATLLVAFAALGACSGGDGGGGNNAGAAANAPEAAAAAPESTPVPAGPVLGPLTAQQICDGLNASTVGTAIGQNVTAATASSEATPQCSYVYSANGTTSNITIAYMRPAEDLGGAEGAAGYDYVVQRNRSMAPGATEQPVQAGQRALRISGTSLHLGVVLTAGRVVTVLGNASLPADAVDRLIQAAGEAFGR